MKNILTYGLLGVLAMASVNCTTSYDAYGNPRQTVTPGGAVAGAAAAGLLTYALTKDNDKDRRRNDHRYDHGRYHNDRHHHDKHHNDRRHKRY